MVLQTETTPMLGESEPPFLQESTVVIDRQADAPAFDRAVDVVYHWRLALVLGLIPLFLAVVALSFDDSPTEAPAVGDDEVSSFESILQGVVPADSTDNTDEPVASTAPPTDSTSPALPLPSPSITTPAETTSTEAPTTETTVEPTTAPTEPPAICLVSVRRRTDLLAEPDDDADELDRVTRGTYVGYGFSEDREYYLIDFEGRTGWVEESAVGGTEGDC